MGWLGNWLGKYLGNWLGAQDTASVGVVVTAAPLLLALVTPVAAVETDVGHIATPVTITVTAPIATVQTNVVVNTTALTVTITATNSTVTTGAVATASPATTTISSTTASITSGASIAATTATISITSQPATVEAGITVPATWTGIVINVNTATVINTTVVNPFEVTVTLTVPTPTITTVTSVATTPVSLALSVVQPTTRQAARHTDAAQTVVLSVVQPVISTIVYVQAVAVQLIASLPSASTTQSVYYTAGATTVVLSIQLFDIVISTAVIVEPIILTVDSTDVIIRTGEVVYIDVIDIFIDVVEPKVYDKLGSLTYSESITVKVNIPEIIAFSTDITTDMQVVEGIEMDMDSVDGTQPVKLLRRTDNIVMDFTRGEAVPENKIYVFPVALIRMISTRDNRAVKQLRLFMQSVQNDEMYAMDTIIELPKRDDVEIHSGDLIESDLMGTRYSVIAIDDCTLKTRWRLGARKLV